MRWLLRPMPGRTGLGFQGVQGKIDTEIPHVVLLVECSTTNDSLGKIVERHGLKREKIAGCGRLLKSLGIVRAVTPRWHSGPRPHMHKQDDPWAWRECELDAEARAWAGYERTQTGPALLAGCIGTTVNGARYHIDHAVRKEMGRKAAAARYERIKETGEYKVRSAMRNCVNRIARKIRTKRRAMRTRTAALLGCTFDQARAHLERQWKPGMTWDNHGTYWEIDHVLPLASFDLSNPAEMAKAMHYTNLQPLTQRANRIKADRV